MCADCGCSNAAWATVFIRTRDADEKMIALGEWLLRVGDELDVERLFWKGCVGIELQVEHARGPPLGDFALASFELCLRRV